MEMTVTVGGKQYRVALDAPVSLAIPLDFAGLQPSFFGAPAAAAATLKTQDFVGDTSQGGSCNVAMLRLVPHCNGTHTESVGHIVHDHIPVTGTLIQALIPARLITVTPQAASETHDTYCPEKQAGDGMITRDVLHDALVESPPEELMGLLVRTLPNDESKKSRRYGEAAQPPYFSIEAMEFLIERQVNHLLVDLPSLDKMHDEGKLTAHHLFWGVPAGHHSLSPWSNPTKTVTEMIYVPADIHDGLYLLNLQVPAFLTEAAPSRPVIYRLEAVDCRS